MSTPIKVMYWNNREPEENKMNMYTATVDGDQEPLVHSSDLVGLENYLDRIYEESGWHYLFPYSPHTTGDK